MIIKELNGQEMSDVLVALRRDAAECRNVAVSEARTEARKARLNYIGWRLNALADKIYEGLTVEERIAVERYETPGQWTPERHT